MSNKQCATIGGYFIMIFFFWNFSSHEKSESVFPNVGHCTNYSIKMERDVRWVPWKSINKYLVHLSGNNIDNNDHCLGKRWTAINSNEL